MVGLYHLIRKYGIRADRISFEITETAIFDNSSKVFYTLKLLKLFGFGLSLDDFGTGHSSLSHLKITPIDTIKVDRSFVKDIMTCEKNIVIIEAIMFIADKFGLKVIAEGVETKQQIKTLSRVGCEIYQGFFFSCALTPDKIEVLHDFGFKRFSRGRYLQSVM